MSEENKKLTPVEELIDIEIETPSFKVSPSSEFSIKVPKSENPESISVSLTPKKLVWGGKKKIKVNILQNGERIGQIENQVKVKTSVGLKLLLVLVFLAITPIPSRLLIPPSLEITHFNDKEITNVEPSDVYHENIVSGKISKTDLNLYLLVRPFDQEMYTIQPLPAVSTRNKQPGVRDYLIDWLTVGLVARRDWTGYCILGDRDKPGINFEVCTILTGETLSPSKEIEKKYLPKNKKIDCIVVSQGQIGSYNEHKMTRIYSRSIAPQPSGPGQLTTKHEMPTSPRIYVDIFLGQEDYKLQASPSKVIVANLYHEGFEGSQTRAEIDWGEGGGWELIEPHIDKEAQRYYIYYSYKDIGEKIVRYRVRDESGNMAETTASIVISSGQ